MNKCIDCGSLIDNKAKRCKKCWGLSRRKPKKDNRCEDCGKIICKVSKRCKSCVGKMKIFSKKHRKAISNAMKGRKLSEEHKRKVKENHANMKGKKCNWYIDGRTPLYTKIRALNESINWRKQVYKRDNYTCQRCGKKGILNAHHIKSFAKILEEFLEYYNWLDPVKDKYKLLSLSKKWEDFWNIDNGITLCGDCHKQTKSYLNKGLKLLTKLKKEI